MENNPEKEDHSTRVTKMIIRRALISLMGTKQVGEISIAELCREAGISRSTFYAYYSLPESVADEIQNEVIAKMLDVPTGQNSSVYEKILHNCKVTLANKDYCLILANDHEARRKFRRKMLEMTVDASILTDFPAEPTPEESARRFALLAVSEGCAGIMNDWHERGLVEPPEMVASMVADFVAKNEH